MKNSIQNFQIPVIDFDRAYDFYSKVMDYELQKFKHDNASMGIFRFDTSSGGVGGTIIKGDGLKPSKEGTMVYLDTGDDAQPYLDRVVENGGSIFVEKTSLGPSMGYFAIFDDMEGNRVGFYSRG